MFKKMLSLTLTISIIACSSITAFANEYSMQQNSNVKSTESIYSSEGKSVIEITDYNNQTIYMAVEKLNDPSFLDTAIEKSSNYNLTELTFSQEGKVSDATSDVSAYTYSNKTYFSLYETESEALRAVSAKSDNSYSTMNTSNFWHGSYIQDYTSWAGHGYHIYLSARDASYITNVGWVACDGIAAGLALAGALTGGAAIVIGAVATIAVLTVYWKEQNNDGSLEIWSPDSMRGSSLPLPGVKFGTAKIGSSWYPLVRP